MVRWLKRHPFFMLGVGLAMGLLVGVGMLAGALVAVGVQHAQADGTRSLPATFMPQIPLHAAAHGTDGFAMATGNINEDVDGLYTLDYLTGDLHCWVFNPRTMDFRGLFSTNVLGDLGVEKGKKPNYAMVTGLVSWVGGTAGPARPANALVYVADCNSGNFAAYGLFINKSASTVGIAQKDALRKVAFGKGRNIPERDK
jgi:hypothetical protein